MKWKTTALLLLTAVAIGAYLSLYELKQPSPEERQRRSTRILDLPASSVTRLVVESGQGRVTLAREEGAWRLGPAGMRADPDRVSDLLRGLNPLTTERTFKADNLTAYGLEPPEATVMVQASGHTTTLRIGGTTPVNTSRYLTISERPGVFITGPALFNALNHADDWFRDTLLLRFNTWDAEQVTLASAIGTTALTGKAGTWRLTQPVEDVADGAGLSALLGRLGSLSISRIVETRPTDAQRTSLGLSPARLTVSVRQHAEPRTVTVSFGDPLPDDPTLVAAARADESAVYAVPAADVEFLRQDPDAWRSRQCFPDLSIAQISKVAWTQGETRRMIEQHEGHWTPAGASDTLETPRVEGWLNEVIALPLGAFVEDRPSDLAPYGLKTPAGSITIWTDAGADPQGLLIGGAREGTLERYGRIEGRPPVVLLPASITELLAMNPDAWRSAPAPGAPAAPPSSASAPPGPGTSTRTHPGPAAATAASGRGPDPR